MTNSRFRFYLKHTLTRVVAVLLLLLGLHTASSSGRAQEVVLDRLWVWAHEAGVYNGSWGLPVPSRITPVEGAHYLGVPNVIFIRYEGKPAPPFERYAVPFKSLRKVHWSIAGASGATSTEEREHVFRLAQTLTNMTGVFMDDFFHISGDAKPQWLAKNEPKFPVELKVDLGQVRTPTKLELRQSDWRTGDYRSAGFAIDSSMDGSNWHQLAGGQLPNVAAASKVVKLAERQASFLRVRILSSHDREGASSCGLLGLKLWAGEDEVALSGSAIQASSTYPGYGPENLVPQNEQSRKPAAAALTVSELRKIRQRLRLPDRKLDLGVTLYTHQLNPRILSHIDLCDVVSLWTWRADDLADLSANFMKLRELMPAKRVLLGCYMWDFGTGKPMPLDRMKHQCALALKWLKEGKIEGIIFLATNICDLDLETVEWTREWIRKVGADELTTVR